MKISFLFCNFNTQVRRGVMQSAHINGSPGIVIPHEWPTAHPGTHPALGSRARWTQGWSQQTEENYCRIRATDQQIKNLLKNLSLTIWTAEETRKVHYIHACTMLPDHAHDLQSITHSSKGKKMGMVNKDGEHVGSISTLNTGEVHTQLRYIEHWRRSTFIADAD